MAGLGLVLALGLPTFAPAQDDPPPFEQPELADTTYFMGAQSQFGALTFAGGLYLSTPKSARFGGLTGIEAQPGADPQSVKFAGVTEHGDFLTFSGGLDGAGHLVSAGYLTIAALRDTQRVVLAGKQEVDAEDLSRPPDVDGWLVSFERHNRINAYVDPFNPDADVIGLNMPAEMKRAKPHAGMEAIAALPGGTIAVGARDGHIWLCPPRQEPCTQVHDKGGPEAFFNLTSLDHVPGTADQMVAAYHRQSPLAGYSTVIAYVTIKDGKAVLSTLAQLPNLVGDVEGISVVAGPGGGWRIYLVTNNDFVEKTPTRLLAFDWKG